MQTMHNFMRAHRPGLRLKPGLAIHPSRRLAGQWLAGLGLAGALGRPAGTFAQTGSAVQILAASDLKFALAQLLRQYQQSTGALVQASYGSSGNLVRQILQGLPADIFMSADEALVARLFDAGWSHDGGQAYGSGRLALLTARSSGLALDGRLAGLAVALAQPAQRHGKLAIANPEHAPYGRAARQALQAAGLWPRAQAQLVLGESAAQAAQFVSSGAAQAALVPHALALAPELAQRFHFVLVDESLHQPLRQRMALRKNASPAAQQLYVYLQSGPARALLRRWGFN